MVNIREIRISQEVIKMIEIMLMIGKNRAEEMRRKK
ncbi:hypothetical protein Aboo_0365 [Aciduliprofundum boonei T469]|uniref:Uncharacterized protein n=1 Tax=Aciduliprofundum boonei (strain DSM 19572 / T469) TaxID=439481 RepID=D3TC91_ACIB4|nr:hypothetical protein Aboo_0365 [Aciduliprofundum boonei T469]